MAADLPQATEHLRHERLDKAEPMLARAFEHHPRRPDALYFLDLLRHAQGRGDEAIESIRAALPRSPATPAPKTNPATSCCCCNAPTRLPRPISAWSTRLGPGSAQATLSLGNLGALYCKLGQFDESERACRDAIVLDAACGDAWYQLRSRTRRRGCSAKRWPPG